MLSLSNDIKPVVEYLETIPGVNLLRALSNSPWILSNDFGVDRMTSNAAWLVQELNLEPADLGRIINGNAYVLKQELARNTQPAIQFLRQGIGLSTSEVRSIVRRAPRMLSYSSKKLESGKETLERIGMSVDQIRNAINKAPQIRKSPFFCFVSPFH